MLFSDRSLWTMLHGIVLGGGALVTIFAALFAMYALYPPDGDGPPWERPSRAVAQLTALAAAILWVAVLTGTYIVFPPYRAAPPEGIASLAAYPRSMLLDRPETAWLHAFAMESKEHMPWIAAMLATAVAYVAARRPSMALGDARLRRAAMTLLAIAFVLVAFTAMMGTLVNKVAPLE